MLVVALEFLLLGFFLDHILSKNLPSGSNSVDLVDGVLIFYFGIDFVLRLVFQKLRSITARQYVLLPISRKEIAHFVLVKTLGTTVNFLPLFILIPYFFTGVLRIHPFLPSIAWLVSLLSLLLFNTYLANYSKLNIPQLTIGEGESFGLVGNNGAGKTTFFSLIVDIIKASSYLSTHINRNRLFRQSRSRILLETEEQPPGIPV